jgi:hypothetical protein
MGLADLSNITRSEPSSCVRHPMRPSVRTSYRRYGKFPAERVWYEYRAISIANRGLTFVFDIRHLNWYIATKIRACWERSIVSSKERLEKDDSKVCNFELEFFESITGLKKGKSKDRNPTLNNVKVLLTQKTIRGTEAPPQISWRRCWCNDPRFYQILGENFRFCFAWDNWKFIGI